MLSEDWVVAQGEESMPPGYNVGDCPMEDRVEGQLVEQHDSRVQIVVRERAVDGKEEWDVMEEKSPDPVVGAVALRYDIEGRPSIDIQRLNLVRNGWNNLRAAIVVDSGGSKIKRARENI